MVVVTCVVVSLTVVGSIGRVDVVSIVVPCSVVVGSDGVVSAPLPSVVVLTFSVKRGKLSCFKLIIQEGFISLTEKLH